MAHAAKISALAESLITSIVGLEKTSSGFEQLRKETVRGLRDTSHARTNQFEIQSKVDGLIEKFSVLNRDDLADAFQDRLGQLPATSKWRPEILSLFLQLSDRPVEHTDLEDVENLNRLPTPPPRITWDEILANEPPDEEEIWKDIERGYHSSGDEGLSERDTGSETGGSTCATSVNDENVETIARLHLVVPDQSLLNEIEKSQEPVDTRNLVDELLAIRESLSMVRGLPTALYSYSSPTGVVVLKTNLALKTATKATFHNALSQLATAGTTLNALRAWSKRPQSTPYLRTVQVAVCGILADLQQYLSKLEQHYTAPKKDTVVSLLSIAVEVETVTRPFMKLSALITSSSDMRSTLGLIDSLYDDVCTAHILGDTEMLRMMAPILFQATSTYLRPVADWITRGSLAAGDRDFFIAETNASCELGELWHKRFSLRLGPEDHAHVPSCLAGMAGEIFIIGKEKMFLQHLENAADDNCDNTISNSTPDFASITSELENNTLVDFSYLFDTALRIWTKTLHAGSAVGFQAKLLKDHGLLSTLKAIDAVFCSSDGALFQTFADTLYDRIDHGNNWTNKFMLTELARQTLGTSLAVDVENITATVNMRSQHPGSGVEALECIDLQYHLPWPVQNITREPTPATHSKTFALLLQVHRARSLLEHQFFDLRGHLQTGSTDIPTAALHLRHRLHTFVTLLHTHIVQAAQILGDDMRRQMAEAADIDAMVAVFAAYKRRMELSLLLAPNLAPMREAVTSILVLCEKFRALWTSKSPAATFEELHQSYTRSLAFFAAGLRGISRAGGEGVLEALAERLEWMVQ